MNTTPKLGLKKPAATDVGDPDVFLNPSMDILDDLAISLSVKSFGAVGDGTTDDKAAILLAEASAIANGGGITFPPGTYKVSDNITLTQACIFQELAMIAPIITKTVTITGHIEGKGQIFTGAGTVLFAGNTKIREVYPEWFGAKGDGVTDDASAIQKAHDAIDIYSNIALVFSAQAIYRFNSQLNLRLTGIRCEGTLLSYVTTPGVSSIIAGGTSAHSDNPEQSFRITRDSSVPVTNVGLELRGVRDQRIRIMVCWYVLITAINSGGSSAEHFCAYSEYYLGFINKLDIYTQGAGDGQSAINENLFIGGHLSNITIRGLYPNNCNEFLKPCLEGAFVINIDSGLDNIMRGARLEGASGSITFGTNTAFNKIIANYSNTSSWIDSYPVTDNGIANVVTHFMSDNITPVTVFSADFTSYPNGLKSGSYDFSSVYDINTVAPASLVPGVDCLMVNGNANYLIKQLTLDTTNMKRFYVQIVADGDAVSNVTTMRPQVKCYDAAGTQLTGSSPFYANGLSLFTDYTTYYGYGAAVDSFGVIFDNATKSATIDLRLYNVSYAKLKIKRVSVYAVEVNAVKFGNDILKNNSLNNKPTELFSDASPTMGIPKVGTVVPTSTSLYRCTAVVPTTVNATEATGQTVITVASIAGISSGDIVGVLLDNGLTHWSSVNGAPVATEVTITDALPSATSAGKAFVAVRWSDTLGDVEIDGALNHDGTTAGFFGTAPAVQQTGIAALKVNYTTGDLDSEAEVIAALNTTNAAINALRTALNALGFTTIV